MSHDEECIPEPTEGYLSIIPQNVIAQDKSFIFELICEVWRQHRQGLASRLKAQRLPPLLIGLA
jgi:hypothetical protein